ncbi:MAG: hypothetical protein KJ696_04320 [Gammaproteobacteria bacterium]|nr:hypothetical protein [Gammaproteobacteria bacterium]
MVNDLSQSYQMRGHTVSYGEQHYEFAGWRDVKDGQRVVGLDQGISAREMHPNLAEKVNVVCFFAPFYFTPENPLSYPRYATEQGELEGNNVIGIFGDAEYIGEFNETGVWPMRINSKIFDKIVGLYVTDHSARLLSKVQPGSRDKPKVSVLFGGSPPGKVDEYIPPVLGALDTVAGRTDADYVVYLGDFDAAYYPTIARGVARLKDKGVDVVSKGMPREEYFNAVYGSDIVISKPGSTTVSEMIHFSQIHPDSPAYLFFDSQGIYTEFFTRKVLEAGGFDVIDTPKVGRRLPERIMHALNHMEAQKSETRQKAGSFAVTNLVDILN